MGRSKRIVKVRVHPQVKLKKNSNTKKTIDETELDRIAFLRKTFETKIKNTKYESEYLRRWSEYKANFEELINLLNENLNQNSPDKNKIVIGLCDFPENEK